MQMTLQSNVGHSLRTLDQFLSVAELKAIHSEMSTVFIYSGHLRSIEDGAGHCSIPYVHLYFREYMHIHQYCIADWGVTTHMLL